VTPLVVYCYFLFNGAPAAYHYGFLA